MEALEFAALLVLLVLVLAGGEKGIISSSLSRDSASLFDHSFQSSLATSRRRY